MQIILISKLNSVWGMLLKLTEIPYCLIIVSFIIHVARFCWCSSFKLPFTSFQNNLVLVHSLQKFENHWSRTLVLAVVSVFKTEDCLPSATASCICSQSMCSPLMMTLGCQSV